MDDVAADLGKRFGYDVSCVPCEEMVDEEEIEELMRQMNQPKLAHVLRDEDDSGDGDPEQPTTNHQPPTTARMSHAQTDG